MTLFAGDLILNIDNPATESIPIGTRIALAFLSAAAFPVYRLQLQRDRHEFKYLQDQPGRLHDALHLQRGPQIIVEFHERL